MWYVSLNLLIADVISSDEVDMPVSISRAEVSGIKILPYLNSISKIIDELYLFATSINFCASVLLMLEMLEFIFM
jgi:hypothetical protein